MSNLNQSVIHEVANSIDTVLLAINTVESKILEGDIEGALYTISLIKDKKTNIKVTLEEIKKVLKRGL